MADTHPSIPACAWQRPIEQDWEHHYVVRYASNLDDGPWHGAPLGGFGAGCIGRSPRGDFNLWHLDGGEHIFQSFPGCQFSVFEQSGDRTQAYALCTEAPTDGTLSRWQWYPKEVRSQELGVRSQESGVRSQESGARSQEPSTLTPMPSGQAAPTHPHTLLPLPRNQSFHCGL